MVHKTDEQTSLARAVGRFLSGTFLSRLSGLGRDVTMAAVFGCHPSVAALMTAFRFSHLFRRLLGEGALHTAFIPYFEKQRGEDPQKGFLFFRDLLMSLSLLLVGLIALGEGGIYYALHLSLSEGNREVLVLMQWLLPSLLFVCLFGLQAALLNCEGVFFTTGVAPVAYNLIWILSCCLLRHHAASEAMPLLAVGIVFACAAQWMSTLPLTLRSLRKNLGGSLWRGVRFFSPELRKILGPMAFTLVGVGAVQINNGLDYLFARYADPSGPAFLWYALRVQHLPIALFGIAFASALLPALSRRIQAGDEEGYCGLLNISIRRAIVLLVPCTVGILVLGSSGIQLLYGRGEFGGEALFSTVHCLWGYGLGLIPAVLVAILAPAFYAQGQYRIPTGASLMAVVVNILLNTVFVVGLKWGPSGIALATSISSTIQCYWLMRALSTKIKPFSLPSIGGITGRVLGPSLCAGMGCLVLGSICWGDPTWMMGVMGEKPESLQSLGEKLSLFSFQMIVFGGGLFTGATFLKCDELLELFRYVLKWRLYKEASRGAD